MANDKLRIPVWDYAFGPIGNYRYLTPGTGLVVNLDGCPPTAQNCGTIDVVAPPAAALMPAQEVFTVLDSRLGVTLAATPVGPVSVYRAGSHLAPGIHYTISGRVITPIFSDDGFRSDWVDGDILVIDYMK